MSDKEKNLKEVIAANTQLLSRIQDYKKQWIIHDMLTTYAKNGR